MQSEPGPQLDLIVITRPRPV